MKNRDVVIAGNWKMNKTPKEAQKLTLELVKGLGNNKCRVIICVPYVDIQTVVEAVKNTNIKVGAQNCHWEEYGAFTGEVSAKMLKDIGVSSVIVGHSERREHFYETNEIINKKVKSVISHGMDVILCVGETMEQMKSNQTINIIQSQIQSALLGINKEDIKRIMIAYEPIWAIGTGVTATPKEAGNVCGEIRKIIMKMYGEDVAGNFIVQYGGSMNGSNAFELLLENNIDGGLIGGASLKSEEFIKIVKLADKLVSGG